MKTAFDPVKHQYFIDDRPVPSVTQVLREVLPGSVWTATPWHMDRGTAVHACAALIAQGKAFEHDQEIDGQVEACRSFFREDKPEVIDVEVAGYSTTYQFAGKRDMFCVLKGKRTIVDWKSAFAWVDMIQAGGYGLLCPDATHGMIVELGEDGQCRRSEHFKLAQPKNEFLACRSVYGIRQRLGLIKSKEDADGN